MPVKPSTMAYCIPERDDGEGAYADGVEAPPRQSSGSVVKSLTKSPPPRRARANIRAVAAHAEQGDMLFGLEYPVAPVRAVVRKRGWSASRRRCRRGAW